MTVESLQSDELSLAATKASLVECALQGMEQSDPLQFYYLQALLENLEGRQHLSEAARQTLLAKAASSMLDYQKKHNVSDDFPESISSGQTIRSKGLSKLKALNLHLQKQQNAGLSRPVPEAGPQQNEQSANPEPSAHKAELQALKHYQQLFEKMAVERLLNKVMQEIPENAGPLNPERVVIRCLSALQAISPVYVMRLMGYYESLISLNSLPLNEK